LAAPGGGLLVTKILPLRGRISEILIDIAQMRIPICALLAYSGEATFPRGQHFEQQDPDSGSGRQHGGRCR
jgi:hypothetical protein